MVEKTSGAEDPKRQRYTYTAVVEKKEGLSGADKQAQKLVKAAMHRGIGVSDTHNFEQLIERGRISWIAPGGEKMKSRAYHQSKK